MGIPTTPVPTASLPATLGTLPVPTARQSSLPLKDRAYVAVVELCGLSLIVLSTWQLLMIATGTAPEHVTRSDSNVVFYIFKGVFGIVTGLFAVSLARTRFTAKRL